MTVAHVEVSLVTVGGTAALPPAPVDHGPSLSELGTAAPPPAAGGKPLATACAHAPGGPPAAALTCFPGGPSAAARVCNPRRLPAVVARAPVPPRPEGSICGRGVSRPSPERQGQCLSY